MQLDDTVRASGHVAAPEVSAPERRIPGEAGFWIVVFGDLTMFAILFATFIHYRSVQPGLFFSSQGELHRVFGGVNTVLLLTSSLLVMGGLTAKRRGESHLARPLIILAMVCGGIFLINKAIEWTTLIADGHTPTSNHYFMYFFVLTGLHALHVVVGLCGLAAFRWLAAKPSLTKNQYGFMECCACFWHLVDALWLVIFPLCYLMH